MARRYDVSRYIKYVILLLVLAVALESAYLIYSRYACHYADQFALSPEEQAWLNEKGSCLLVSAEPDFPPIAYVEHGQIKGLIEDYYRLLEKRLHVRFVRIAPASLSEMITMVKAKQLDIVGPLAQTDERAKHLLFTQPIFEYPAVVVVSEINRNTPTLESLRGKRIAVSRDYAIWPYLKINYPFHEFVAVANDRTALKLVAFGQVDAAISDVGTATDMIKHQGFSNLVIGSQAGYSYVLRIGSNRDEPMLNAILTKALASIPRYERDRIYRRWIKVDMGPMFTGRRTAKLFLALSLALLALLAAVALWNNTLSQRVAERTAELRSYQDSLAELVDERTRELSEANNMLSETNDKLSRALAEVKTLSGFIPICAYCKKVRDDQGDWKQVEDYIASHSNAEFSHGLCPDCLARLYPEFGPHSAKELLVSDDQED